MWDDKPPVSQEDVIHDIKKLEEFFVQAKAIEDKVEELRKVLAVEFMVFANERLGKYEYNTEINNAVYTVVDTAGLDEYNDKYDFWLPSNIGC